MTKVDKEWFIEALTAKRKSMRELAKHLDLDIGAVSRTLDGKRRLKMEEANSIATFLGVPVSEILGHAGAKLALKSAPVRVMIAATIDERGNVAPLAEPRPLPQGVFDAAGMDPSPDDDRPLMAAQVRAGSGPLAILDDALLLYRRSDAIDQAAIGALSICRNSNGGQIIGKVERARKTGEAQIVGITGKSQAFDLEAATPIVAIIP